MLRDPSLVPLSRQHQHALALCVRIRRAPLATAREVRAWQAEVEQHFQLEIQHHFAAEEACIFPKARGIAELSLLVDELLAEHAQLRADFAQAQARTLDAARLRHFVETLSGHIRKEEGLLFEGMQRALPAQEMQEIGELVAESLARVPEICITPTEQVLKDHQD
jgi:hemerythrin-like domain-containing protein